MYYLAGAAGVAAIATFTDPSENKNPSYVPRDQRQLIIRTVGNQMMAINLLPPSLGLPWCLLVRRGHVYKLTLIGKHKLAAAMIGGRSNNNNNNNGN